MTQCHPSALQEHVSSAMANTRGLHSGRKKKHIHYKTTGGLSQERKTALDCMISGGTLSEDTWVREQEALGLGLETDKI